MQHSEPLDDEHRTRIMMKIALKIANNFNGDRDEMASFLFLEGWKAIRVYTGKAPFYPYILQALRWATAKWYELRKKTTYLPLPSDIAIQCEQKWNLRIDSKKTLEFLKTHLTSREWEILRLRGEGLTTQEICAITGRAPGTINCTLQNARRKVNNAGRHNTQQRSLGSLGMS